MALDAVMNYLWVEFELVVVFATEEAELRLIFCGEMMNI